MPSYSAQPIDDVDAAARIAFCYYCELFDDLFEPVRRLDINPRSIERIYAGRSYLPRGLARAAADHIGDMLASGRLPDDPHAMQACADDLRAWAEAGGQDHG